MYCIVLPGQAKHCFFFGGGALPNPDGLDHWWTCLVPPEVPEYTGSSEGRTLQSIALEPQKGGWN